MAKPKSRSLLFHDMAHHAILVVQAHVETLGYRFDTHWTVPDTMRGSATFDGQTVTLNAPRPTTAWALAIVLHELGHILHGHLWRSQEYVGRPYSEELEERMHREYEERRVPNEVEASRFALNIIHSPGHALKSEERTEAELFLIQCLTNYGLDMQEAANRLNVPLKAAPYLVGPGQPFGNVQFTIQVPTP